MRKKFIILLIDFDFINVASLAILEMTTTTLSKGV